MKKMIMIAAVALVSLPALAQRERGADKFATFGFDFGINRSNLEFRSAAQNGEDITNGLGYRLGVISNFRVSRKFSFQPKAELSFNATKLSENDVSYKVNPANLELMGHLRYKLFKGNLSPYVLAGPNARITLGNQSNENLIPTRNDVAIDVGAGLDVPLGGIMLSPEVRYSYGLTNIQESVNFSDLNYHNIALVLKFTGR